MFFRYSHCPGLHMKATRKSFSESLDTAAHSGASLIYYNIKTYTI